MKDKQHQILHGHIPTTLIRITIPSVVGMFGFMIFNIVDTYFVGKLGSVPLAAISFTFPVVMVLNSLVFGIGVASMTLFSKAAGQHNEEEKKMLASSSLALGITISIVMGVIGYSSITPLFRALGADDQLLGYITRYMKIWYLGTGFMVIPMLGDSILRGLGDTFTPAFVMMTSAGLNIILDPLMIFGIGPFPEMGIEGAALATVISRGVSALVSILIQAFREHLLTIHALSFRKAWTYWKQLFHIGLPNSAVKAITPLGTAFFTSILAGYGHEVVAGYGVATKLESVFIAFINAFGITTTVFIGQNLGAGNHERVKKGILTISTILFSLGLFIAAVFFFSGNYLAGFFTDDLLVRTTTARYLRIVPIGYGFFAFTQMTASILNVYHKPYLAGGLSLFQIGMIAVPASYVLSYLFASQGVFAAIVLSFCLTGLVSLTVLKKQSAKHLQPVF